jgi:imidazolonepropionase-like amidohydrolase
MFKKDFLTSALSALAVIAMLAAPALAQDSQYNKDKVPAASTAPDKAQEILITNVSIFNGTSGTLITGQDVVLNGNKIARIIPAGSGGSGYGQVIDGKGGYLSPGLIDAHSHATMGVSEADFFGGAHYEYVALHSAMEMEEMLMRGVTTMRDAAGNTYGLKRAIDEGVTPGPRIHPSGAALSQYSGHGDFRGPTEIPKEWGGHGESAGEAAGFALLANGPQQVTAGVRQQLFLGATQIKIAVAGGVSSFTDPLYVVEFSPEEIQAAVKAAEDYGTYVMAHSHSSKGVIRAVENGVLSIEHGSLLNEEAAKLMAEKGVVYIPSVEVLAQLKPLYTDPIRKAKLQEAMEGTSAAIKAAKKYDLVIGFGTDLLFDVEGRKKQLHDLTLRKEWFSSAEIMIQATGNGGKIVGLCGKRNPYGKVGVIEEGAMADVLIYSKNPLEDVAIVEDAENNLKLIMKDGKVYKNTL